MIDALNIIAALLTIGFGAFGFLAPRFTASALDLSPTNSTMGLSEMRASVGGLFVAMGIVAILSGNPAFYVAIGIAFTGAALGRVLSMLRDAPPMRKVLLYFGIEAVLAIWLIGANIGAIGGFQALV